MYISAMWITLYFHSTVGTAVKQAAFQIICNLFYGNVNSF